MRIAQVIPREGGQVWVIAEDGRAGLFDVSPYLTSPAFKPIEEWAEFSQIRNGGYFVEWPCGADLSADTIEARWTLSTNGHAPQGTAAAGQSR